MLNVSETGRARGTRRGLLTAGSSALASDVRVAKLRATLRVLSEQGQTSRAALARATGLTRGTVSGLVADLIEGGLVVEVGAGPSTGGKPPTMLALNAGAREVIALDLSRQPFRAVTADLRGRALRRVDASVAGLTGEAALDTAHRLVDQLVDQRSAEVVGVGIACPGMVTEDGRVLEAASLEWHDIPLATSVAGLTGRPVWVANDADAAALAEHNDSRSSDNLAVVKIDGGIGLGLILNGRLYHGTHAAAGEVGHIVVLDDGPPCICGAHSCLEAIASVPAIHGAIAEGREAADVIDSAGRHLASVLATLVAILDIPEVVIALAWPAIEDQLLQTVQHHLQSGLTPAIRRSVEVRSSRHAPDLVLRGVAALVLSEELGLVLGSGAPIEGGGRA